VSAVFTQNTWRFHGNPNLRGLNISIKFEISGFLKMTLLFLDFFGEIRKTDLKMVERKGLAARTRSVLTDIPQSAYLCIQIVRIAV